MLNLARIIGEQAELAPDTVALTFGDRSITRGELAGLVDRAAGTFEAKGLVSGDRIALVLPNVPQFVIAYYGALKLGLQVVPLSPLLSERELGFVFADSGARAVIGWSAFEPAITAAMASVGMECGWSATADPSKSSVLPDFMVEISQSTPVPDVAATDPGDVAVVLYTSGTTGNPKGAALTHNNLAWNARLTGECSDFVDGDAVLCALPFFHSFGQTMVMNVGLDRGVRLVLMPRFDPVLAADLIEREHIDMFLGVPSMLSALLAEQRRQPRDVGSLRWLASGGAPITSTLHSDLETVFGAPLFQGYGLSETSPITHIETVKAKRPGTVGRPVWGVEQRIVDISGAALPVGEVGQVQVRGHAIMTGYINKPEVTEACIDRDGWFSTGDLGRIDSEGYLSIVGRAKDLIIRNGLNVYPTDVEDVLAEHPAVHLVAVIGIPDEAVGEEIAAIVVLRDGATADPSELQDFVRERVSAYEYPRSITIVDTLPLGPSGKVLKRKINLDDIAPTT